MKFLRLLPCLLMAFVSGNKAIAQSVSTADTKKALLQHMLHEKMRLPGKAVAENDEEQRTTAATDGRVSTASPAIDEGEISLAYNPTDSSKIVLSYMEQGSLGLDFPIYYSSNGGATWTRSSFNSMDIMNADFPHGLPAGGGDPVFAWDKMGTVYFGWIYLTVTSSFDTAFFTLNWAYSTDNGHTWNIKPKHFIGRGVIDITSGNTLPLFDGVTDREWFAVDNSGGPHQGNLYCSYVCFPAGTAPAFEAVKTKLAGVDTFGPAVHAFDGNSQFGNLEVDKNGIVHMSLADIDHMSVRHTKSSDGGASFSPSVLVGSGATLFPDPPFVVHNRENGAVNLAVDGPDGSGNNVHIVWSDYPGTTVNSFYSHSADGGNTWTTPLNLNTLMPGKITFMPTVAANGNNVAISFTAIDSVDSARYYQFNSTDNGATFPNLTMLSSASSNYNAVHAADTGSLLFFGDYNRSARTQCVTFASWEDCRSANSKVYFARTNYCTLGVKEITLVNGDAELLSVFPNPASNLVTLDMNLSKAQVINISVTDMAGRAYNTTSKALQSGNQHIQLPLNDLSSGAYLLTVRNAEGVIATRSLIVK